MKFNFLNWILETISTLLVIFTPNELFITLYILVNSCGTPLIYFLGIEDNRKRVRKDLEEKMSVISKKLPKRKQVGNSMSFELDTIQS